MFADTNVDEKPFLDIPYKHNKALMLHNQYDEQVRARSALCSKPLHRRILLRIVLARSHDPQQKRISDFQSDLLATMRLQMSSWPIIVGRTSPEQTDFPVLHQQFHTFSMRPHNGITFGMIQHYGADLSLAYLVLQNLARHTENLVAGTMRCPSAIILVVHKYLYLAACSRTSQDSVCFE